MPVPGNEVGGQHLVKPQTHMEELADEETEAPSPVMLLQISGVGKNPALAHPPALESTD